MNQQLSELKIIKKPSFYHNFYPLYLWNPQSQTFDISNLDLFAEQNSQLEISTVYDIGFQRNRDQKIRVCGKNLLCKIVFAFFDYFANIACVEIKTLVLPIKIFNLENYIKFSPNIMMYILYILCIGKCIFAKSLLYFSLLKEVQF